MRPVLKLLLLLGIFLLPFVGASLTTPGDILARAPTAAVVSALLLWLLLVWSIALSFAWAVLPGVLQALAD